MMGLIVKTVNFFTIFFISPMIKQQGLLFADRVKENPSATRDKSIPEPIPAPATATAIRMVATLSRFLHFQGGGAALFCTSDNTLLIGKRAYNPGKGKWSLPGGRLDGIDKGDLEKCAKRELREETGIKIDGRKTKPKGSVNITLPFFQWITYIYFLAKKPRYTLCLEFSEMDWVCLDELQSLPLNFGMKKVIQKIRMLQNS
jgi:8-oxo-dGTP pyrophosphatase MutT (NUDIX family)